MIGRRGIGGPGRGVGPGPGRGPGRRRVRRRMRRVRRRRVIVGGAMVCAVGNAAYKFSQPDAEKIEQASGKPIEEMTEQEVDSQMDALGIEDQEVTDADQAALESDA